GPAIRSTESPHQRNCGTVSAPPACSRRRLLAAAGPATRDDREGRTGIGGRSQSLVVGSRAVVGVPAGGCVRAPTPRGPPEELRVRSPPCGLLPLATPSGSDPPRSPAGPGVA